MIGQSQLLAGGPPTWQFIANWQQCKVRDVVHLFVLGGRHTRETYKKRYFCTRVQFAVHMGEIDTL